MVFELFTFLDEALENGYRCPIHNSEDCVEVVWEMRNFNMTKLKCNITNHYWIVNE